MSASEFALRHEVYALCVDHHGWLYGVYFSHSLAGVFLFYSSNLLWIETRRRTDRRYRGLAAIYYATFLEVIARAFQHLASSSASSRCPHLSEETVGAHEIGSAENRCDRIGPSQ